MLYGLGEMNIDRQVSGAQIAVSPNFHDLFR
jgi:hypothetical protein